MIVRRFYEELGLLLYAVCMSDGEIQAKEKRVIDRTIDQFLSQYPDFEKYGHVKNLLLTKIHFYHAIDNHIKPSAARNSFLVFVKKYRNNLDGESRKIARLLLQKVASAYGGVSAEESQLLKLLED